MSREIMYRDGLREAIDEEMARDPTVFIIGEGIADRGGSYKITEGLLAKYGAKRVRDTPTAEAGMIVVGVGAAIAGARPIVEILYIDFAMLGMDMIVKFRLMTGGEGRVPFVMRTQGGTGGGVAAQHSQSLEALFYHIPGLKVVMPSTPAEAKGLLKYALRQSDPVMLLDLPAHGGHAATTAEDFSAAAAAVRGAIGGEGVERLHLVGHSVGAAVAASTAGGGDLDVRSLTPISPAGLGPKINGD